METLPDIIVWKNNPRLISVVEDVLMMTLSTDKQP
jgi:hypothetical protein